MKFPLLLIELRFENVLTGDDRSTRKVTSDNVFKRGTGWRRINLIDIIITN